MTDQQAIAAVIQTAKSQIGYREGNNNWNKYAADLDPLNVTYGAKQNQPWCGEFVLWVFDRCFGIDKALKVLCSPKPTGIPLCRTAAQYFKDAGRWSKTPAVGGIVFYFVSGAINHTGIVVEVDGNVIRTVEGNSGDKVSLNTYSTNYATIAGYGIPKWDVVTETAETPVTTHTVSGIPTVQRGCVGEVVRAAQILLIGRGYTCGSWGADGDFGNGTYLAAKNFQTVNGLETDGVIGPLTWAALLGL